MLVIPCAIMELVIQLSGRLGDPESEFSSMGAPRKNEWSQEGPLNDFDALPNLRAFLDSAHWLSTHVYAHLSSSGFFDAVELLGWYCFT
jgi:hypothetical protein